MMSTTDVATRESAMPVNEQQFEKVLPMVDIYEQDDEILLYADMPGVKKEDVSVHIDNGQLEINGVRRVEAGGAVSLEEFSSVEYGRTFSIPQSIDVNKVQAELKDGVLCLHLCKAESAKPRVIEIKAA